MCVCVIEMNHVIATNVGFVLFLVCVNVNERGSLMMIMENVIETDLEVAAAINWVHSRVKHEGLTTNLFWVL